jgi:K+-sensing histidine kinase KdpD
MERGRNQSFRKYIQYVVSAVWKSEKIELDELRNIFILTLAHDLQMPLVGERTALEFLQSRNDLFLI